MPSGSPEPQATSSGQRRDALRLFALSFLALFVELAFIRLIPAHIRVVGYFTNLVLIASFLGLGLGFLLARRALRLAPFALWAFVPSAALLHLLARVEVRNPDDTLQPLWLPESAGDPALLQLPIWVMVALVFSLAALSFIPLGQFMARQFERFPRLHAYSLDLGGSLCGIVSFGVLSYLRTGPVLWFSVAAAVWVLAVHTTWRGRLFGLVAGAALVLTVFSLQRPDELWSRYYLVEQQRRFSHELRILTNGVLHQSILDLDSEHSYSAKTRARFEIPYRMAPALDDVLIVGAGSGNDIAIARAMGAKHIDAVEIDDTFVELGRAHHPQAPYAGDVVTVHITDARAYFKRCQRRYDLIVFGTLDAQTLLSGLSSVRLDNFVYTRESFQEAHQLLKPGGLMAVFHLSMLPFIAARISLLLTEVGGRLPLTYNYQDPTLFNYTFIQGDRLPVVAPDKATLDVVENIEVPTDDWPFLFLERPTIPPHYVKALVAILLMALLGALAAGGVRLRRFDFRMFLLGAGFLLLETKAVTQMSLLFGSTWVVNLLVFSSILFILLIANLIVLRLDARGRSLDPRVLLIALCFLLIGLDYVSISWLSGLPEVAKWMLGGALVALPVGLAGLVFPTVFRHADDYVAAFGANLLGAIAGGVAEYFVMWLGISVLSQLAALLYIGVFLASLRRE